MALKSDSQKKLIDSIHKSGEASPGLLFWRSFNNWQRRIRNALEAHDLTQVQYSIMAAVFYLGSDGTLVTQQGVANALVMDKMMVSDVIKILLKKKNLLRQPHPDDARAYALSLSSIGKKTLKLSVPLVESIDEEFFRSVGTHYSHFFQGLKILANLKTEDTHPLHSE